MARVNPRTMRAIIFIDAVCVGIYSVVYYRIHQLNGFNKVTKTFKEARKSFGRNRILYSSSPESIITFINHRTCRRTTGCFLIRVFHYRFC